MPSKAASHYSKIIITRKLYSSSYKRTSWEKDNIIVQIPTVPKVNYEGWGLPIYTLRGAKKPPLIQGTRLFKLPVNSHSSQSCSDAFRICFGGMLSFKLRVEISRKGHLMQETPFLWILTLVPSFLDVIWLIIAWLCSKICPKTWNNHVLAFFVKWPSLFVQLT